jgi:hypothetical protein
MLAPVGLRLQVLEALGMLVTSKSRLSVWDGHEAMF